MFSKFITAFLAVVMWAIFSPGSWPPTVQAQIPSTSGSLDSSQICQVGAGGDIPRNTGSFWAKDYTFTVTGGNVYTIEMNGTTVNPGGWNVLLDTYLYLTEADGTTIIACNDDVILGGYSDSSENRSLIKYSYPVGSPSKTVKVIATSWAPVTYGSWPKDSGGNPVPLPYTIKATTAGLGDSSTVTSNTSPPTLPAAIANSAYASSAFAIKTYSGLTPGLSYAVTVTPAASGLTDNYESVDTVVWIADASNNIVGSDLLGYNAAGGLGFASKVSFPVSSTGTYTIFVTRFSPSTTATSYEVTLETPNVVAPGSVPNVRLSPRLEFMPADRLCIAGCLQRRFDRPESVTRVSGNGSPRIERRVSPLVG